MSYPNQPLGTIIASVLNYDELCVALKEHPAVDPRKSSYAPCDGREVRGSGLDLATNHKITATPDLRGRFLRGLNEFYNPGEPPLDPKTADPDGAGRKVMGYQPDAFAAHNHPLADPGHIHPVAGGYSTDGGSNGPRGGELTNGAYSGGDNTYHKSQPSVTGIAVADAGGSETRPRNVAVYYYIKIN